MDGFGLCRAWKKDPVLKKIPFVFYTATYTDTRDEEFALSLGAERFIIKPHEPEKLVEIIQDVFKNHKGGKLLAPHEPLEEETKFYKEYNETLIRKLENKMLQLKLANQRLISLYQGSQGLAALKPKNELVLIALRTAVETIGFNQAIFFEYDEGKHNLRVLDAIGISDEKKVELKEKWIFDLGEERGLVGLVAQTLQPLIVSDTSLEPRWVVLDGTNRSALFVPVQFETRLWGVAAITSNETDNFNEEDARNIITLANNLAIALESAWLFKRTQSAELYFRTILESSADAIISIDPELKIKVWNFGAEQIFGFTREEIIGQPSSILIPPQEQQRAEKILSDVRKKGFVRNFQTQRLAKGGNSIDVEMTINHLGTELGYTSVLRDITERKHAQQRLNALNQASVAMGAALTHEAIFNAIAEELKQLDIHCMLFMLDKTQGKLFTEYMSFNSALLNTAEKLVGFKQKDFSFLVNAVDVYQEVVREKKTVFSDNSEQVVQQVLPKHAKKLSAKIIKILNVQTGIFVPIIVKNEVIGVFSIQSNDLKQEDIPATNAFAHELANAWEKTAMIANLKKTVEGTIHALAAVVETRDPYTAGHQKRVSELAAAIASEMHLTEQQVESISMAGIIHDLGKIQVPAEILSKPGQLSELEFNLIKTHPQVGYDLLKNIEFPWPIAKMILQHHEKMNGSGYPQGLKGDEIMLEARILTVADVVEAMSSHRPYRPALGIEKALKQIRKDKGILLDPDVVDACLKLFKQDISYLRDRKYNFLIKSQ